RNPTFARGHAYERRCDRWWERVIARRRTQYAASHPANRARVPEQSRVPGHTAERRRVVVVNLAAQCLSPARVFRQCDRWSGPCASRHWNPEGEKRRFWTRDDRVQVMKDRCELLRECPQAAVLSEKSQKNEIEIAVQRPRARHIFQRQCA